MNTRPTPRQDEQALNAIAAPVVPVSDAQPVHSNPISGRQNSSGNQVCANGHPLIDASQAFCTICGVATRHSSNVQNGHHVHNHPSTNTINRRPLVIHQVNSSMANRPACEP